MAFACGEIGLKYSYFLSLDFRQFDNIATGYHKKQQRLTREGWEQTRLIMAYSLLPYTPKHKELKPKEILPLPWDNEITDQTPEVNPEETQKLLKESVDFWAKQDKKNS